MSSSAGAVVRGEYNRPRRADPDTVSYLRSLPLDEAAAAEEVRGYVERKRKRRKAASSGDRGNKDDEDDAIHDDDEEDIEYPQSLAAALSAIDEIRHEAASLACDEYGSQALETVARIGAMRRSELPARKLLAGLSGYHLHLAAHRYGSHVVQTVLSCAVAGHDDDDDDAAKFLAEENEQPDQVEDGANSEEEQLPPLAELILSMADELLPHAPQLAVHVTASHVLRTLLCALGGVELVVPSHIRGGQQRDRLELGGARRGKNKSKKKKKKKKQEGGDESSSGGGGAAGNEQMRRVTGGRLDPNDRDVREALRAASVALSGGGNFDVSSPPGELQQLACHPCAGPLLVVLLRVLAHASSSSSSSPEEEEGRSAAGRRRRAGDADGDNESAITDHRLGIVHPEPTYAPGSDADRLVKRLLCWQEGGGGGGSDYDDGPAKPRQQPYAGDVIYGLSGEPRGSRVLEAILRVTDDATHDAICRAGRFFDPTAFREYAEHDVSNFVLQTLYQTVRNAGQAAGLMECVVPLIESGYVLDGGRRRGGVLWRAAEMCAKYQVGQESLLRSVRVGYAALRAADGGGGDDNKGDVGDGDDDMVAEGREGKKKSRHKKRKLKDTTGPLVSMEECVPRLINIKPREKEGGRVGLDVAGARTVYHMLRFAPKQCTEVLNGIVRGFSCQKLEWIANDGLGSRCILDPIVEGGQQQRQQKDWRPFSHAARELLDKLSGRWVALSVERVGHHLVKKLFRALRSMDNKATLTAELARGINRLGGNAMGRSVIASCSVKEFLEGEAAFKLSVTKEMQREEWLKDVLEMDDSRANDDGGEKKRKRKKKRKKKSETDRNDECNDKQTVVESIMSTLSAPSTATD